MPARPKRPRRCASCAKSWKSRAAVEVGAEAAGRAAAAGTQFALERGDLKNGVFTYSILEAMNKYPTIKISELRKIVGERVEKLTNGLQKPTSRNETISSDWEL